MSSAVRIASEYIASGKASDRFIRTFDEIQRTRDITNPAVSFWANGNEEMLMLLAMYEELHRNDYC